MIRTIRAVVPLLFLLASAFPAVADSGFVFGAGGVGLLGKNATDSAAATEHWSDSSAAGAHVSVGYNFADHFGLEAGVLYGLKSAAALSGRPLDPAHSASGSCAADLQQTSFYGAAIGRWPSVLSWHPYGALGLHTTRSSYETTVSCDDISKATDSDLGVYAGAGIEWRLRSGAEGYGDGPHVSLRAGYAWLQGAAREHAFHAGLLFRY